MWTWAWPSLEHGAADGDRGVEVAVVAEVADRATVQPAALALGRGDQLHRADLGGAATACRPGRPRAARRARRAPGGAAPRRGTRGGGRGCSARPPCTCSRSRCPAAPRARGRCGRGRRASRARRAPSGRAGARSARSSSSAGVAPRGRVPAIGWVVSWSPSTWSEQLRAGADDLERRACGRRTGTGSG